MKAPEEYSEIHLARIYLLMASCCAMPSAACMQPPAKSICHIAILTLMGAIDDRETLI